MAPPRESRSCPRRCRDAAAAVVGDRLYAIGGRLAGGKLSDEVQEYDVATEHSVIAARLPNSLWRRERSSRSTAMSMCWAA